MDTLTIVIGFIVVAVVVILLIIRNASIKKNQRVKAKEAFKASVEAKRSSNNTVKQSNKRPADVTDHLLVNDFLYDEPIVETTSTRTSTKSVSFDSDGYHSSSHKSISKSSSSSSSYGSDSSYDSGSSSSSSD